MPATDTRMTDSQKNDYQLKDYLSVKRMTDSQKNERLPREQEKPFNENVILLLEACGVISRSLSSCER